jgi:hypothetical protein
MGDPKTDVIRDVERLKEPFKSIVKELIEEFKTAGLRVKPFETLRTMTRQKYLVDNKRSKTWKSYHLVGMACDFVVHDKGGWSWGDRDVDFDGQTKDELEEYIRMGKIINEKYKDVLEWGGNWGAKDGKLGWDAAHIQYKKI